MVTITGRVSLASMIPGTPDYVNIHFQDKETAQVDMLTGEVTCDGQRVNVGEFFLWLSAYKFPNATVHWERNYKAAQKAEFTSV